MIRITGGQWRGLRLRVPPHGTRPTSDLLRQGVFSSLGAAVVGARVLDLFAGSGAYGIEALSRGAAAACWVEDDRAACATLLENLKSLASSGRLPPEWIVIRADATKPARYARVGPFDLIFADPPYALASQPGWIEALLRALADACALHPGGRMVLELSARVPIPSSTASWRIERARAVGESQWLLLRPPSEPDCEAPAAPICSHTLVRWPAAVRRGRRGDETPGATE